jgi:hypothetical protein
MSKKIVYIHRSRSTESFRTTTWHPSPGPLGRPPNRRPCAGQTSPASAVLRRAPDAAAYPGGLRMSASPSLAPTSSGRCLNAQRPETASVETVHGNRLDDSFIDDLLRGEGPTGGRLSYVIDQREDPRQGERHGPRAVGRRGRQPAQPGHRRDRSRSPFSGRGRRG